MDILTGHVEHITYQNEETGYTVLQLRCSGMRDPVCVVGKFPSLMPGEALQCQGEWSHHLVHGRQFRALHYKICAPADLLGIRKYLGSGLIKGIGPIYASKIVDRFGLETLHIIDQQPEKLESIEGLGPKRIALIRACWAEQSAVRDVMIFLQGHGISPAYAQKIFKKYGMKSIQIVSENPYRLARDIFGIGFKMADTIAQTLGIGKESPERLDAGIEFVLRELSEEGHVCYPHAEFLPIAAQLLETSSTLINERLSALETDERIVRFPLRVQTDAVDFLWLRPLFLAETGIATQVQRLQRFPSTLRSIDVPRAIAWAQKVLGIELASAQAEAVMASLTHKLHIITGGPGTGKSTITKAILTICSQLTDHILLAAPTGRAAKRLSEITKKKAQTIHSLLEFDWQTGGFKRQRTNPLECDLLIIDEASMIDTLLMYQLLRAVPDSARVIFVGDIHQLPSVGAGNVLKDLIASLQLPVTTLNQIFRQAQGSRITVNAHKINQGHFPEIHNDEESDFFFVEANEPEEVLAQLVALVVQRLPAKYHLHPMRDIQLLAPMKKGVVGTENLNTVLQNQLNPNKDSLEKYGRSWRPGDKVMQIRNNYQKEVFNGDIGYVHQIDREAQTVHILFDERLISYEFHQLDELVLAYAVSVHKYQGSECPCIVMPVHTTHFKLLHRNLLYTGVTRGKKLVVLVGTKKALAIAVHNDEVQQRYTGLQQALRG